jgi:hypothetical protein
VSTAAFLIYPTVFEFKTADRPLDSLVDPKKVSGEAASVLSFLTRAGVFIYS